MYKVIVFAGTTEGYELAGFLAAHQVPAYVCVATEYGTKSLTEGPFLHIEGARLNQEEMAALFEKEQPELVLDATHPYAAEVTENIVQACRVSGMEYVRVLREEGEKQAAVYVDSTEDAVEYLKGTQGNILLTTGSKELKKYTALPDFQNRIYARVLSLASVMTACSQEGFEGKHLIGMQGPFSTELNAAMLRQYDCRYLVTKDTGRAGGFSEKIEAAKQCGATAVIIGRPSRETGLSVSECRKMLCARFQLSVRPEVTLVGIGMGSTDTLTVEGQRAIKEAQLIIGASRMVQAAARPHHRTYCAYKSEEIVRYIRENPQFERVAVVLSGDVGFYSGARKLLEELEKTARVQVICGISSVAYFMAKIGQPWDDARLVSAHGRSANLVMEVAQNQKVFAILGTRDGISGLCGRLTAYGLGEVTVFVGERLSYPDEHIFSAKASELTDYQGDALSVVCVLHPQARPQYSVHGIPDEQFIRGKAPMTKEEVRCVSLSKMRIYPDSVIYDVGAGTGSVSIELALCAGKGRVYAIEKKADAVELIRENKKKFRADNLEIIEGCAPEALENLPVPTHAFIGGSSGNLAEIIARLWNKNPGVRIVLNCITLETLTEALQIIRTHNIPDAEIVQMNVAQSKTIGRYHMMMGENPIYIISFGGGQS